MKTRTHVLPLAAVLGLLAAPAFAQETTGASASDAQWQRLDTDVDGQLSRSEAAADPALNAAFDRADTNGDGQLSGKEIRAWQLAQQTTQPTPQTEPEPEEEPTR